MAIGSDPRVTQRRYADGRQGALRRMAERNRREAAAERLSRCYGRPGCQESPTLTLYHVSDPRPFGACQGCGERLLVSPTIRLADEGSVAA